MSGRAGRRPRRAMRPATGDAPEAPGAEPQPPAPTRRSRTRRPAVADQSVDDTDAGWGERGESGTSAEWLRAQRPPHWE